MTKNGYRICSQKIKTKYSERKVIENEEKCFISGCFLLSFFVWLVYFGVNYFVPELLPLFVTVQPDTFNTECILCGKIENICMIPVRQAVNLAQ